MGTVTTAMDTAVAVTITDGTEAAVTTNGTTITIAAGKAFAASAFVIPIARTICECSDANGRADTARPVQQAHELQV
jgi:hypothetical protein